MKQSIEYRKIKGDIIDKLIKIGYKVNYTDSINITMFTDKPINNKSYKIDNSITPFITSFGKVEALKFIKKDLIRTR